MSKILDLYQISSRLTLANSKEEIYDIIVEALSNVLKLNSFEILLKEGNLLKPVRMYGIKKERPPLFLDGKGITVASVREGKTIYVPDVREDSRYIESNPATISELAVPIKFGNDVIGVINIESPECNAFTREEINILEIFASMVAAAIKNIEYKCRLASSERKYRSIFENAVEGIYRIDADGKIIEVNPALEKLLGYTQEELKNMDVSRIYKEPRRRKEFMNEVREKGVVRNYEVEYVRKDGKIIIGNEFAILVRDDGREYIDGIIHDITDLKKAQQESEFYNSLLRHDIANKLQIIYGYLEVLAEEMEGEEKKMIETALKSAKSAIRLIDNIRKLRKVKEMKREEIDLGRIIKEVVEEYSKEAGERGIKIITGNKEGKAYANELLKEAISNIVWNSIIHSKGDEIKIWVEKGNGTCIFVRDNGTGISKDIKDKVFEMGVKGNESSGSGLGLYLVKKIIDECNGTIEVMDAENGGTVFKICLPDK